MPYADVYTQEQLDDALKNNYYPIIRGNGEFVINGSSQVTACDSSQVRAYDSSQVTAYGSSQVRAYGSSQVTAYDSSQVRAYGSSQVRAYDSSQVTAYGSSQVRAYGSSQVRAYGSSQVRAYGSSQVRAYDSSQVRASNFTAVTKQLGFYGMISGGVLIELPTIDTAEKWCEFYGIEISDGVVTLYKAIDDDYATDRSRNVGIFYKPGCMPSAPDWDGGVEECGGGLHFCATPAHALSFNRSAKRFIACPVMVNEIVIHYPASYPEKVKVPRVCQPCWEVDIDGNKIEKEGN